jgi:transposase-like protein
MAAETIEENGGDCYGAITRVAKQVGVGVESLRAWVVQAEIDGGKRQGLTTEERAELKRLQKENQELKRSNEMEVGLGFLRGGARPPVPQAVRFIDDTREEFGVEPICKERQIAPSTYYQRRSGHRRSEQSGTNS